VSPGCAVTDAARPVVPVMAVDGAVMDTTGAATSTTLALALAVPTALVTLTPSATGPGNAPAVKTIVALFVADVIVPPAIVHAYVTPTCGATDATRPVVKAVASLGALIVGVVGGLMTVTVALPLVGVPAMVTVHPSVSAPALPAVNVMAWVPWPAVIVPSAMVHAYVAPACDATDASSPVAPDAAVDGAVIDTTGVATTVTVAVALAEPAPFVTVTPSVSVPTPPAVKTMVVPSLGEVMVPPAMLQT
jgi:hypothetical protein